MNFVALLGIVNTRVEKYPLSRAAQSELAVITASTLISPKLGLLSRSLPGAGGSDGAQEPTQTATTASKAGNFRDVDN
jgi:hypothetical protein